MCESVCEWENERHTLYSALDKGAISKQSIYHFVLCVIITIKSIDLTNALTHGTYPKATNASPHPVYSTSLREEFVLYSLD